MNTNSGGIPRIGEIMQCVKDTPHPTPKDGNNRDDIPVRFTVSMLGQPGKPMLTLIDEEELARRKNRRAPLTN